MNHSDLVAQLTALRPRPTAFVAVRSDKRELTLSLAPGTGRWKKVATSILQHLARGSSVEARDVDNAVVFEWLPDMLDDDDAPATGAATATSSASLIHSSSSSSPATSTVSGAQLDEAMRVLVAAEDAAVERTMRVLKPITDGYMALTARLGERLDNITGLYARTVEQLVKANIARGEAEVAQLATELKAEVEAREQAIEQQRPKPAEQFASAIIERFTGKPMFPAPGGGDAKPDDDGGGGDAEE